MHIPPFWHGELSQKFTWKPKTPVKKHTFTFYDYFCREPYLHFACSSHVAWFTVAHEVVDELDAVLSTDRRARVGETLVDIPFAARPHETRGTAALEPTDFINARSVVVTCPRRAIIDVDLANNTQSS